MPENDHEQKGFIALVAVVMFTFGAMAFSITVLTSASLFADSVYRRELRVQKVLNEQALAGAVLLKEAKGY